VRRCRSDGAQGGVGGSGGGRTVLHPRRRFASTTPAARRSEQCAGSKECFCQLLRIEHIVCRSNSIHRAGAVGKREQAMHECAGKVAAA
jgi:hypothetical protein